MIKEDKTLRSYVQNSPSLGSIAPTVSWLICTFDSYKFWPRKAWNRSEDGDLLGSNKDIHTVNEWTSPDFECESSSAWPNILATKLIKKIIIVKYKYTIKILRKINNFNIKKPNRPWTRKFSSKRRRCVSR